MTSNVYAKSQTLRHSWSSNAGTSLQTPTVSWNDFRIGEDDPKWREKVAQGIEATNSYSCYERNYDIRPLICKVTRYGNSGAVYSWTSVEGVHNTWCVVPGLGIDPNVINEAYVKFNQRVSAFVNPFKGMTFLGELREAVGMLRGRTKTLLTDVFNYRKALDREIRRARQNIGDKTLTRDVLKRAGDSWLEYAFGWKPLIGDIETASEILLTNKSVSKKVSAKADLNVVSPTVSSAISSFPYNDYATFVRHTRMSSHTFSRVVGQVDLRLLRDLPGVIHGDLGLTAREFVPTLWELMPYSFLADYFFNVGDIINGVFSETRALTWLSQTTKCLGRSEFAANLVSLYKGPYDYAKVDGSSQMPRVVILARSLERFTPVHTIPSFEVRYPELGSQKYLNMVSLLLSRIHK